MKTRRSNVAVTRVAIAGLVLLLTLAACRGKGTAPAEKAGGAPLPTIEVVRVVEAPVSVTLSMPAELEAYQSVAIHAKVTGFVKTIRVDRGSRVRAGELLATLEAPELVAHRSEAESRLESVQAELHATRSRAEADASTYEKLKAAAATPGVVAGNDLVLAERALEVGRSRVTAAEQNVEAARQSLKSIADLEEYLNVNAPFDGVVTERSVHPGALVGPSGGPAAATPMVRLVDTDRLRVVVPVPEAYIAVLATGADIPFTVAAYPGETFSGAVARIARAVDVKTRTMAVELDVVNHEGRLAPGAFCQVRWPVKRPGPSLLVPSGSVANTTGRTFVVRIRNGRAEWVDVKTGFVSGAAIEVFGDLKAGDEVAARGTDEIRSGTEVSASSRP